MIMNIKAIKLIFCLSFLALFVACGKEGKKSVEEEQAAPVIVEKAIQFEDTGDELIDAKLAELSVVCVGASGIDNMSQLLDYQEKYYGKNLKSFEDANKERIEKLSKEKKKKYKAAQKVLENYFLELMKVAQQKDEIKRKQKEEKEKQLQQTSKKVKN